MTTSTTSVAPLAWRWYSGFQKCSGACCWQTKKAASGIRSSVTKASENETVTRLPSGSVAGREKSKGA